VVLVGCQPAPQNGPDLTGVDEFLVRSYGDDAIRNALVTQSTLFPYHFVNGTAQLNSLGEHDLAILVDHLQDNQGRIRVLPGAEDRSLYERRVATVSAALGKAGLDVSRVQVGEAMPAGDGLESGKVIEALEAKSSAASVSSGGYGGTSMTTVSSGGH